MGFKRTSEGRVFFETPEETPTNVGGKDLQIVGLLKALNTRLKDGQLERARLMQELTENRRVVKSLEARSNKSEQAYIDLEQRIAVRQNESSKKSTRAENVAKDTLKEILETKEELGALKEKTQLSDKSFSALKARISQKKQTDDVLRRHQMALEKLHREQSEKMVNNVAAYVALTKRVNDAEAKFDTLDNKIEDTTSKQLNLDKKLDKSNEDRNRMLRKVDRIEEAVLETRDALNAKAMVVLADQGVSGKTGGAENTDPLLLESRAPGASSQMVWLGKNGVVTFLFGALLTSLLIIGLTKPISIQIPFLNKSDSGLSSVSLPVTQYTPAQLEPVVVVPEQNFEVQNIDGVGVTENVVPEEFKASYAAPVLDDVVNDINALDITNEQELLSALENNPQRVALAMNNIEPGDVVENTVLPVPVPVPASVVKIEKVILSPQPGLEKRIKPDTKLSKEVAQIEKQAFALIPEAQHDLAAIYTAGHGGVSQNFSRAALWFKEAAGGGVANASYNLGVLYQQGLGVDKSLNEAIKWYQAAAELDHPEAEYNLGIAYIEGIGVPYNPVKAAKYFEGAASQGIMEAAYNLGLIHENALLGNSKPDEALIWYKAAADQGSPEAKAALEQLAKTLNIKVKDINDLVDSMASPIKLGTKDVKSSVTEIAPPIKNIIAQPLSDIDVNGDKTVKAAQARTDERALVASIQANLIEMGLYPGPADGINGPLTADAVRAYQLFHDFEVDGEASEDLLDYMEKDAR